MSVLKAFDDLLKLIEGSSVNEKVRSIINELNKELNSISPFCGEFKLLKRSYVECQCATLLSMLISIFYIWMFCESYFFDYSISKIISFYITSQMCFSTTLYGLIKFQTVRLKFRKRIIKLLKYLLVLISSDDFSLIDDKNDQSEIPDKISEIEGLIEEIESRGRFSQKDILLVNMTLLSYSITWALLVMYFSSYFPSSKTAIAFYVIFVSTAAFSLKTYIDERFDKFQSHDVRSTHEIKKNVLKWIKTSSTGSTI